MTPDQWRTRERLKAHINDEAEWLACTAADSLLGRLLELGTSDRKLRLFGCACCRLMWHNLVTPEGKSAVEAAEQFAVGETSAEAMRSVADSAKATLDPDFPRNLTDRKWRHDLCEHTAGVSASDVARTENEGGWPYWERLNWLLERAYETARHQQFGLNEPMMNAALCERLRDIIGNPFRPVRVAPEWRSETVLGLARGIVADRALDRLPILADALEETGCSDADLLTHCRGSREHVLGCWVVDLLLGYGWQASRPV